MAQSEEVSQARWPAELPIEGTRVIVHTELGVPIVLDTSTGQFFARPRGKLAGRGSTMEVHSPSFARIVDNIRRRALVHPINAYVLDEVEVAGRRRVRVRPITVIEYHRTRREPWVIQIVQRWASGGNTGRHSDVTVTRAVANVMLPNAEQIRQLQAVLDKIAAEERRHAAAVARFEAARTELLASIRCLNGNDVRYTQQTGFGVAHEGLAQFELLPEENDLDLVDEDDGRDLETVSKSPETAEDEPC